MSNTPIRQLADATGFDLSHMYQGVKVRLFPIALRKANDFVDAYHRHTGRTSRDGGRYAIGAVSGGLLRGVVIVGNPLSATLMDGMTAEVLRLCVDPSTATVGLCSKMYSAAYRAWKSMGGMRMVTYTLKDNEPGTSLLAAGWAAVGTTNPSWGRWSDRTKTDGISRTEQAVLHLKKTRWEIKAPDFDDTRACMVRKKTVFTTPATTDNFWDLEA